MRTSTGAVVTACALSAALVAAGCGADVGTESSGEVFLEPAAAKGPDPFTDSTVISAATPAPVTRTPQPSQSGRTGPQPLSGGTPGLYAGTRGTGSCDVQRQIDHLAADRARAGVFARAAGIPRASIPGYLRSLTSVVLRADTRVTNHGFRDGHRTGYQSVLQAGTAVLVDGHGVPRVRCACGNPLAPAAGLRGNPGTRGRPWSGYRPAQVVVVAPTIQVITNITIIDIADNTWIERPTGHRGHDRDHALQRPKPVTPTPHPHDSPSGTSPGEDGRLPSGEGTSPSDEHTSPEASPSYCVTPAATVTPGATDDTVTEPASDTPSTGPTHCPTATAPAFPREPGASESGTQPETSPKSPSPSGSSHAPEETGPELVPDSPDLPDGGGLIPDEPNTTDSIFGSPTNVFDG
ncbi:hypothetical protein PBV52_43700 [Streptomyces sp. T12]|uniref:DUF6777 domain-containing protein n=2 Tax=unclassified Streptomyces TaxID=2593676 RepID=UPI0023671505|nr:DUF6777 domain-containing protein [Streptomyces sp. T12]WDF43212.1 hypothetical protein PBV52_43700 [Streptomyces sp. T12]